MRVKVALVPREQVGRLYRWMVPDLVLYKGKSPHQTGTPDEIFEFLMSPEGDELIVVGLNGAYAGFLTFRVQEVDGERWGTIGMLLLKPEAQEAEVLPEVRRQLEAILKERGCDVMNFMTSRKGFARLAPRLGMKARITEWMKEL